MNNKYLASFIIILKIIQQLILAITLRSAGHSAAKRQNYYREASSYY